MGLASTMLIGMFGTPLPVTIFGIVSELAALCFVIGAVYLGGGSAALRRQTPQLTLIAVLLSLGVVALPVLSDALGASIPIAIGLVLLSLSLLLRVQRGAARARTRAAPVVLPPSFRNLIVGFVVVMIVNFLVLVVLSAAHAGR